MSRAALLLVPLVLASSAALAQEDGPRFCPNRPSLGESACTTEPGHVQLEVSAIDWTRSKGDGEREDQVLPGDFQVRVGLTSSAEAQLAWSPYGHVRTRDLASDVVDRVGRVGDITFGLRQNLRDPDGKGLSIAVEPQVVVPVGRMPVGAGTWGAGLVVPVTYDLSDALNLALTSEVDAAPDEDGRGRHFAASGILGLSYAVSDKVTAVAEVQVERDVDPDDRQTRAFAAGSLAWQPRHGLQFDVLVGAGLNHDAADLRVLTGGAIGF